MVDTVCVGLAVSVLIFATQLSHALFNSTPVGVYFIDHTYDAACVMAGCVIMGYCKENSEMFPEALQAWL